MSFKPCILIVDDDPGQRSLLTTFLSGQGFLTITASSGEAALSLLADKKVDMMISDVRMGGMTGLETMREARLRHTNLPVLMVTAYADIRDAVNAMKDGAVNYLEKPIDLDELLSTVCQTVGVKQVSKTDFHTDKPLPEGVVIHSGVMQDVFRDVSIVAPSDSRVLISGESGVGKEVVADVIHSWSSRHAGSLLKINCAAIPEELLESELFGHEKGAFTGATGRRIGLFEDAKDGTLFLDEIAEMSPQLQAKLLRVIQDGSFQRIGSNQEHRTNARIIAATNRNLEEEVEHGRFREDLFFRLNVMEIFIPPLRERRGEILPLATRFAAEFMNARPRFSQDVIGVLEAYAWPGNIRELRNAMERATLMARGGILMPEHLPKRIQQEGVGGERTLLDHSGSGLMDDIERQTILKTLVEQDYNRSKTAALLGISRRSLQYKLQKFRAEGFQVDKAE